jgi:hypothetical protein
MKELSVEELEELIASDNTEVKFDEPTENVMRYIKGANVESGKAPVANFVIYYHYCKLFEPNGKKASYVEFFRQFNKVFQQRRTGDTRYYMLNNQQGTYKLDGVSIDLAKQFREEVSKK